MFWTDILSWASWKSKFDKQCERCEAELKIIKKENCSKGLCEIDVLEQEEDKPEVVIEADDKTNEKELSILLV